jgi:hypothetical protein
MQNARPTDGTRAKRNPGAINPNINTLILLVFFRKTDWHSTCYEEPNLET